MNKLINEYHEKNRLSWNEATKAHNSHKGDQAAFFRNGGNTLFPEELKIMGDLKGKSLVHLQCNAGQDSLSLVHRGAKVLGVDISDVAIDSANDISKKSGVKADFVRFDVYDWFEHAKGEKQYFDIAFSSYGAICWLSDLDKWAEGITSILKPNGFLAVVDFHPLSMIFDEDWNVKYPYAFCNKPIVWEEGIQDYIMGFKSEMPLHDNQGISDFKNPNPSYEYCWGIADIFTSLIKAGLRISVFEEYPYANGVQLMKGMVEKEGFRMFPPSEFPAIPLMYGLRADRV